MKIQFPTGIFLALLASATLMPAHAQSANGSSQNTGNKQSTAQTNGASGQRKSGQVVQQDYNSARPAMPNELATLAPHLNQTVAQGSGSANAGEKLKVRQEFGPQSAAKRSDLIAAAGSGGNGGKPKADPKAQSPR